ncbi:DUF4390 domain-containing protein [Iodobacter sp. CM08]|uniref:DUF4390 domain-containing protein n=1 Tax=Iodobacter sp. CM08 TaxID=3085902 RepID=UPI002982998D|nr:DUF4390 domain-containing protein [Iodobacter sp. CM08]MDW5416004.1 DUF4390 domain-containing protein [Iodobacter sp. CM08]
MLKPSMVAASYLQGQRLLKLALFCMVWLCCAMTVVGNAWADAGEIKAQKVEASFGDNRIEIAARFDISLSNDLQEALKNGLSLSFVYEFQLTRPRIYSWYRQMADGFGPNSSLSYQLSYHALSRQYRLHVGSFYRNFQNINEALAALGIVRNWGVLYDSNIARDKAGDFAGKVRLKLDRSRLPKTYQLTAFGHEEWQLESPWVEFTKVREEASSNE